MSEWREKGMNPREFVLPPPAFHFITLSALPCGAGDYLLDHVHAPFDLKNCNMMFDIPAYFASSLDSLLLCHSALPL